MTITELEELYGTEVLDWECANCFHALDYHSYGDEGRCRANDNYCVCPHFYFEKAYKAHPTVDGYF